MCYKVLNNGFESTGDVRSIVGGLFASLGIPVVIGSDGPGNRRERRRQKRLGKRQKAADAWAIGQHPTQLPKPDRK